LEKDGKINLRDRCIEFLLKYRLWLSIASILVTLIASIPIKSLYFESDYKIYFEDSEPHLLAHESMQDSFTKTDNLAIILQPSNKNVFTEETLSIIHEITELGWQAPYVIRVDSLTNFQHTSGQDDDLVVEDLVLEPQDLTPAKIESVKEIALSEKSIVNRLASSNGDTAVINIVVELPPNVDPQADLDSQNLQRTQLDEAYPEIVGFGRQVISDIEKRYPNIEMHLSGVSVVNNSFTESTIKDFSTLIPLMYLVIIFTLALFLRSIGSVVGTLLLIGCASLVGLASATWFGYALNLVNVISLTIILTIAVCDCVHLLVIYLRRLGEGVTPLEAMGASLRLNAQPIILTSITTAIGFLTLNFSISPPFQQFGNMTAVGVLSAMVLTFTLLPGITVLLVKKRKPTKSRVNLLDKYAAFVVRWHKQVLAFAICLAIGLMSFIPLNVIDDDPISYFKPGVPFRDAADFLVENLPGVKDLNFSIDCGEPSCINDVDFLRKLEEFEAWLTAYPGVVFASSYTDVIKRLNRSMNNDDEAYYRVPDDSQLSAQYNLLYEMSLPYGLDLNNQINIDKSSALVTVLAEQMTTDELIDLEIQGRQWLSDNHPELASPGASVSLMFAHLGVNNIRSMLIGGLYAIIGVTLTILIALRSVRLALISLIPNSIPALMAFGVWGLTVGQINMAVAGVFSISLGIMVDDTVHFISKYRRARRVLGLSPEQSIHFAFDNVGSALIVTTLVLVIGFCMLTLSDFNLNSMTGALTAITIGIALILDFLILPPLLMIFDKDAKLERMSLAE